MHGSLEALTQASFIFILAIAIILLNLLVIATFINFRGEWPVGLIHDTNMLQAIVFRSPRGR